MRKLIIVLLFILINLITKTVTSDTLEITIPIVVYESLSKTISNNIIGASQATINKKDLKKYNNSSIHEILNFESGINSRSLYGSSSSGSKTTIDIRGMGAQAKSNVLILVNGQRLNNIDMSEIDFPSIPIDTIDKIEIYKGNAATVLYGDGAIGGAINIITNPDPINKVKNEFILKNGTFNKREYVVKNFQKFSNISINSYLNHMETDGYRDENEQQQNNFSSEIIWPNDKKNHLLFVNYNEQIMSTPSDRSQSQLYTDRRGSDTPDDYINSEGGSFLYSFSKEMQNDSNFIFNSSLRIKNSYSDLQSTSFPSYSETYLNNYQITPRVNYLKKIFNKRINSTYGVDLQYADYESFRRKNADAIPLHDYDAWQSSQSFYSQQSIGINRSLTLGLGLRIQRNIMGIGDHLDLNAPDYDGSQTEHLNMDDKQINYATNLGAEYVYKNKNKFFFKLGNGFRYPNIDDRIGGSGDKKLNLNTQKSIDLDLGYNHMSDHFVFNLSTYLSENKNELAYDADNYVNTNIPSSRRYGIELSTKNKINEKIAIINNLTFAKAKFTSNYSTTQYQSTVYNASAKVKGNDIPLVPNISFNSRIQYNIYEYLKVLTSINYQDDMRMENDEENFQNTKIPSHLLFNLEIKSEFDHYFGSVKFSNLFDKKYYNYAVSSSNTLGSYNAYPEPGREIMLTFGFKY